MVAAIELSLGLASDSWLRVCSDSHPTGGWRTSGMQNDSNLPLAEAWRTLVEWLDTGQPPSAWRPSVDQLSNEELVTQFAAIAAKAGFTLNTVHNPSALHHESTWQQNGQSVPELGERYSAEEKGDAELLACAGLVRHLRLQR
jgi:hypothetical protein